LIFLSPKAFVPRTWAFFFSFPARATHHATDVPWAKRSPQSRGTNQEIIMFDTHEFVATIKSAGATEEQATLALKAIAKAIETEREGLVTKDAMTDLKLFIGTQFSEMNVELSALDHKLSADIKNLRFVILATWSVLIAAIGLMVKYLMP
jgi:protein-disulfide isomerase-like protein with CxxC motif